MGEIGGGIFGAAVNVGFAGEIIIGKSGDFQGEMRKFLTKKRKIFNKKIRKMKFLLEKIKKMNKMLQKVAKNDI